MAVVQLAGRARAGLAPAAQESRDPRSPRFPVTRKFIRRVGAVRTRPIWPRFGSVFGGAYDLELPTQPRLILDLGANVGYASVYFALRHPTARVIAVEPEPSNVAVLRRNVAGLPSVAVVEGAVWPHSGRVSLQDPGKGQWGMRVQAAGKGETSAP